ncbi:MAG: sugar transferase, partial [Roseovarius sp.]|nr:sugar transferase [Roseovarius sp.]
MTPAKRLLDILLAVFLAVVLSPLILAVAVAILVVDGRPIFYLSERMKTSDTSFCLWKFRTMRNTGDDGGVSAGYKRNRITPLGAWLRRQRLDDLRQLITIRRGVMSFVRPRPPLSRYV